MNHKTIRRLVVLAMLALSGLMTVQIVWFKQAYDLQQRQVTEKANSALYFMGNQLNDVKNGYPSVFQTSTNTFRVQVNACLNQDKSADAFATRFCDLRNVGRLRRCRE
jgi:hypothetical protein